MGWLPLESFALDPCLNMGYVNCFHVGVGAGTSLTYEAVLSSPPTLVPTGVDVGVLIARARGSAPSGDTRTDVAHRHGRHSCADYPAIVYVDPAIDIGGG